MPVIGAGVLSYGLTKVRRTESPIFLILQLVIYVLQYAVNICKFLFGQLSVHDFRDNFSRYYAYLGEMFNISTTNDSTVSVDILGGVDY